MTAESKPASRPVPIQPKAAGWVLSTLSVAALLGIPLTALLPYWIAPILVAKQPPPTAIGAAASAPPVAQLAVAAGGRVTILQVVTQRAHNRRQAKREGEGGALGKAGVGGEKAAAATPAAAADAKKDAKTDPKTAVPPAEALEPDVWSDAEIIAALRDCLRLLAPLSADIEVAQPVKQERCGAPVPVVLKRMGSGTTRVELQPPAMLNCAMVASLHTWVEKTLQPAAQELLGSSVVRIRNVSGYVCRNRAGTTFHSDTLSEHALANAIDISAFVTADGRAVEVLKQWGPTARDLDEQQERAAEAVAAAMAAAKEAETEAASAARAVTKAPRAQREEAKAEADRKKDAAQRKRAEVEKLETERRDLVRAAELLRVKSDGGQTPRLRRADQKKSSDARGPPPTPRKDDGSLTPSPEAAFLRRLHKGACGTFGTVLGPDANEAHRGHFHFDLAARKRSAFCE
jgi:hypothetical protein